MKSTLVITTMLMAFMGATLGYTSGLGYTSSEHIAYTVQSSKMIPQDTITPKKQTPRKKDKNRDINERTLKDQKRDTTSIPMPPEPPVPQPDTMPGMRMK
ncbi:hypothetical protein D3C87_1910410 [compost metagenome]